MQPLRKRVHILPSSKPFTSLTNSLDRRFAGGRRDSLQRHEEGCQKNIFEAPADIGYLRRKSSRSSSRLRRITHTRDSTSATPVPSAPRIAPPRDASDEDAMSDPPQPIASSNRPTLEHREAPRHSATTHPRESIDEARDSYSRGWQHDLSHAYHPSPYATPSHHTPDRYFPVTSLRLPVVRVRQSTEYEVHAPTGYVPNYYGDSLFQLGPLAFCYNEPDFGWLLGDWN